MANTIVPGDRLVVKRRAFGTIGRGDIVAFRYSKDPTYYLGRIVGLPNEDIQARGTSVFANGTKLPERIVNVKDFDPRDDQLIETGAEGDGPYRVFYVHSADHSSDTPFAGTEPYHIPESDYFIMGDNRDNSEDSRYRGPVSKKDIFGKAVLIYWSSRHSTEPPNEETRWDRIGKRLP